MKILRVVACVVVANKRILLVRKRNTQKFMFLGGKADIGENDVDCLVREVIEEVGCQLDLDSLFFLGEYTALAANENDTQIIARVYTGNLQGEPTPSNEIEDFFWYDCSLPTTVSIAPLTDCVIPKLLELNYL